MTKTILTLGIGVRCQDGQCGKLTKLVVDPDSMQVTDLIIEEGLLMKKSWVVPISVLKQANTDQITLSVLMDDVQHYPEYQELVVEIPADRQTPDQSTQLDDVNLHAYGATYEPGLATVKEKVRQGIASNRVVIEQGTVIKNKGEKLGKVEQVVIDPKSRKVQGFFIKNGTIFIEHMMIPQSFITQFNDNITVFMSKEEIERYKVA